MMTPIRIPSVIISIIPSIITFFSKTSFSISPSIAFPSMIVVAFFFVIHSPVSTRIVNLSIVTNSIIPPHVTHSSKTSNSIIILPFHTIVIISSSSGYIFNFIVIIFAYIPSNSNLFTFITTLIIDTPSKVFSCDPRFIVTIGIICFPVFDSSTITFPSPLNFIPVINALAVLFIIADCPFRIRIILDTTITRLFKMLSISNPLVLVFIELFFKRTLFTLVLSITELGRLSSIFDTLVLVLIKLFFICTLLIGVLTRHIFLLFQFNLAFVLARLLWILFIDTFVALVVTGLFNLPLDLPVIFNCLALVFFKSFSLSNSRVLAFTRPFFVLSISPPTFAKLSFATNLSTLTPTFIIFRLLLTCTLSTATVSAKLIITTPKQSHVSSPELSSGPFSPISSCLVSWPVASGLNSKPAS
ncbi:hypothetical protein BKA61DRAFT_586855 [Leptodontidium sp. MPI-SDFR-AT-0119]|nr:hypothetical protein BKA61DRAFT_586855 [Leptodontidium sp. MPI-SDFR-AT-0119]